jgi:hypothetical protein
MAICACGVAALVMAIDLQHSTMDYVAFAPYFVFPICASVVVFKSRARLWIRLTSIPFSYCFFWLVLLAAIGAICVFAGKGSGTNMEVLMTPFKNFWIYVVGANPLPVLGYPMLLPVIMMAPVAVIAAMSLLRKPIPRTVQTLGCGQHSELASSEACINAEPPTDDHIIKVDAPHVVPAGGKEVY